MPDYRLYHLDPHTGHINRAEEMFAADDVAAMYEVQQRACAHPFEVWSGRRKVGRVDAIIEGAASAPRQTYSPRLVS